MYLVLEGEVKLVFLILIRIKLLKFQDFLNVGIILAMPIYSMAFHQNLHTVP